MSSRHFTTRILTARKEYSCDACEFILDAGWEEIYNQCSFDQKLQMVKAKNTGYRIFPGQKYKRITGIYEGQFYCLKCIPEIDQIAIDSGVYEE